MSQFSLAEAWRFAGRGITNPCILLGTALEAVFFIMLLALLKRHDVSLIWPLTSLGFVLTALAAKFIRHEEIMAGGELRFAMQAQANRHRATARSARPYSMSH
jgi:hypothetical protein